MLQDVRAFRPSWKFTTSLTRILNVTGASQAIDLTSIYGSAPRAAYTLRVVNNGSDTIWFCINSAAAAGNNNSVPMLPNTVETFFMNPGASSFNVIGTTGSGSTVYITAGESA